MRAESFESQLHQAPMKPGARPTSEHRPDQRTWKPECSQPARHVDPIDWIDLRGVIVREIGMNAEDAFSTMMLFVAPWLGAQAQSLSDSHVLVYRSFFERLRLEPSEDFGRILANVVQTVQSARGSVRALYSPSDLRPFHALPLAPARLLDVGGVVACA